ncbi:MAG: histidine kinase [Lachnospiraceae bacterium]|nr:histidine kinase [Lachnospiraceae bacterium]
MRKWFAGSTESFSDSDSRKTDKDNNRKLTLRQELFRLLLLVWFLPLLVLMFILIIQGRKTVTRQVDKTVTGLMDKASELSQLSIEDCIRESRDASYNSTIRLAYLEYGENKDAGKLRSQITRFLEENYKFNSCFNRTVLVFADEPEKIYQTQNNSIKIKQLPLTSFQEEALPELLNFAKDLGTNISFMQSGGRVYMVRNIVDNRFVPYAVLIMELNIEEIFKGLYSIPGSEGMTIFCNGSKLYSSQEMPAEDLRIPESEGSFLLSGEAGSYTGHREKIEGNDFTYMILYDRGSLMNEWNAMKYLLEIMPVSLAVLLIVAFLFVNNRISNPVLKLKEAARSIAEGKYGETVISEGQNTEIAELTESFNRMSVKLDEQFNKIFLEEIALRDANIHALQSQIDPHFLNNTLEIINWETRLSGNEKASRMIESLSTMMEATTNRDKRSLIPLSEELSYVRAYIYIIQCRYGDRFNYEEKVPEHCLAFMVPRLIIQPVMENAVKYGVDSKGNRYVGLFVSDEKEDGDIEECLRLRIVNHGVPDREKLKHIEELLAMTDGAERNGSVGIQNVNRRLKMLYGDAYGLDFSVNAEGDTTFTIIVKKDQNEQF